MMHRVALPLTGVLLMCALASPSAALAQGRGRPKQPHSTPTATPSPTTAASSVTGSQPVAPVASFRQFGTWLEDATVAPRGDAFTSISAGRWQMAGTAQTDLPMISGGVGLSDRMQVSATVPFYQSTYQGASARGVDDIYVTAKYNILDPTLTVSEIGFAVSPVVEILSGALADRLHLALPVSIEVRRLPFRVYGAAGYFTRGSMFSGAAVEWTSSRGMSLTGSVTQSYSVKADPALDAQSVSRQRADVSGALAVPVASNVSVSISGGRSLTSIEQGGTTLALSGGVS